MKREEIQFLETQIDILGRSVSSLEDTYKKKNEMKFKEAKKDVLRAQRKIEGVLSK